MTVYKTEAGQLFELAKIQNPRDPRGGATPATEPTYWFWPLELKRRGRIPEGYQRKKGALPEPVPEALINHVFTTEEITGAVPTQDEPTADPDKNNQAL